MKRIQHKDLLKIKRPVLLFVEDHYGLVKDNDVYSKLRILYPNGKCEYVRTIPEDWLRFAKSCFSARSLKTTVVEMENFDEGCEINGIYLVDEL